jgi:hypothetical protein
MTLFVQVDAAGVGAGDVDSNRVISDIGVVANGDTGLGFDPLAGGRQQVTYARTLGGAPQLRLETLVNTAFTPDYGSGPQAVAIIAMVVGDNFVLSDGTSIQALAAVTLPPAGSGLPGDTLNPLTDCLVIYDMGPLGLGNICVARAGSGGVLDLGAPSSVVLYHELSHALRIGNNNQLALTVACNPSSPEEHAAIDDENVLRTQNATAMGVAPVLRDPNNHCAMPCGSGGSGGSCCIIASVASGSPISPLVQELRHLRDTLLRRSEAGFAFFQALHQDYYDFSPQVCTLMAGTPGLSSLVLQGYVEPLMIMLRTMQARALADLDDAALGRFLIEQSGEAAQCEARLEAVRLADRFWTGDEIPEHEVARRLSALLRERAWPSVHIRWGLVEPVRIYRDLMAGPRDPERLGRAARIAIDEWTAGLPIDHVWASMPIAELTRELEWLDSVLLRSETARMRFRERLLHRFGGLPPVRRLLGAPT